MKIIYNPKKHKSLNNYLLRHNENNSGAYFRDSKPFYQLLLEKYLLPEISEVRVLDGKDEKWYNITIKRELIPVDSNYGKKTLQKILDGKKGARTPQEILDGKKWEAIYIFTNDLEQIIQREEEAARIAKEKRELAAKEAKKAAEIARNLEKLNSEKLTER